MAFIINGLRDNKKPAVRRVLFVNGGAFSFASTMLAATL